MRGMMKFSNDENDIINKIMRWAQNEEPIKVMILQGSFAAGLGDRYSDYDLALFCSHFDLYVRDDEWLKSIAPVWINVPEKLHHGEHVFPTRLVIFSGGVKVDFAFYSLDVLQELIQAPELPGEYNR